LDRAAVETRVPRDLPPYLADLYRTPLLSPARERALFLKFNFHKYQFATARRKLEPEFARARDLNRLEQHLRDITATRNDILQANLRLVVSVARRHVRTGVSLMELISEGNVILMRAVEGFDIHKGNRFSTYATLALMKGFAQAVPQLLASRRGSTDTEILSAVPDGRYQSTVDQRMDRDHVQHLLGRLDDRERQGRTHPPPTNKSGNGWDCQNSASGKSSRPRWRSCDRSIAACGSAGCINDTSD
jgi:RNA polymerase sigma factor (sigma-70 family)